MKMKKRIIVFLICIGLIGLTYLLINLISYFNYDKSTLINKNSQLYASNDILVEITPDGTIYEHDFKRDPKKVCENSDIIYMDTYLLIKKDGGIYFNKDKDYIGEKLSQIDDAISVSYSSTHIAIITKDGKLFVTSMLNPYDENFYNKKLPTDFTLVKDIPKVKKVVCGED